MRIVKYTSEYQKHFEKLNRVWVDKYFKMEPMDEALLLYPEDTILRNGGEIFFVEYQGEIIGTVALVPVSRGIFEMAKMAVDERFQGLGVGKLLCKTVIEEAKKRDANKLILFTNSQLKTASAIYHKFGFQVVSLIGQEYSRVDIKMELLLKPKSPKWFNRKFNFNISMEKFPELLGSMELIVLKFQKVIQGRFEEQLNFKPNGKWSIKEHIGHLCILEPLWQKRFLEIKENKVKMSATDLNNQATNQSFFNQFSMEKLLSDFQEARANTIRIIESMSEEDFQKSLYHPRLNQPMRIIDLMYFITEHDTHHLNTLLEILDK
ncbi:GNAT family N-acetyltransferase [Aequorivita sp. SDUM287046]|uniref:GNAT family N-acetyltransferase n=1 Tax=Aequorivita aurantiaca TaxID=3053356 RepID=A0ABT8DPG4_9FLAO|nr:GNAT family N-acetyltransferase [Aequorivita aurantiaca]MDN3725138.1 GNAT family N-acetyltransferase [Aequorivita aurantiaca]